MWVTAVVLSLATLSACSVVTPGNTNSGNFELLILHNNDMHARFEQTSQLSGACTIADREAGKCYGGFPRVAHVVKEARKAAQNGEGPPVLYLNAGDTYTGTAWFTIYKWKIAAEFINAIQPDAVSLGTNDIEESSGSASDLLRNINTYILSSNVILKSEQENLKKHIIINIKDVKVGIIGYLHPDNKVLRNTDGLEFNDEVNTLKEEVANLRSQGVNVIIALGHSNLEKDTDVAREVDGLDLVIAGQQNNYHIKRRLQKNPCKGALFVTQKSGRKVPVIPSCSYDSYLGKILVEFDSNGEIAKFKSEPILLNSSIVQEKDAVNMLRSRELDTSNTTVIGKTAVVLDGASCKSEECNLGNLITDSIAYYHATRFQGESPWTDASIVVIPSGDIAGSISPTNRPADVTWGNIFSAMGGGNDLVAVTMTGTVLNQMLEHSLGTYSVQYPTGQLLQMSGIRAVYDLSKDKGSRIVSAVARCSNCWVPEFYVIENSGNYKVIMPASMAEGAYGYDMLVNLPKEVLSYDEVTTTAEYISLRSPVYPEVAGRMTLVNYEGVEEGNAEEEEEEEGEEELIDPEGGSATSITSSVLSVALLPFVFNRWN